MAEKKSQKTKVFFFAPVATSVSDWQQLMAQLPPKDIYMLTIFFIVYMIETGHLSLTSDGFYYIQGAY